MKPTMQLQLGQHLTLTPQLQQAIRLLQLSSVELQQEIQESLDSNPLLEADTGEDNPQDAHINTNENKAREEAEHPPEIETELGESNLNLSEALQKESLPQELENDSAWEDVWQTTTSSTSNNNAQQDNDDALETQRGKPTSLKEYLLWQADISKLSDNDHLIATALIDAINEQGFLGCDLNEIRDALSKITDTTYNEDHDAPFELDEIEAVLHQIQNFEPIGVGARNLQECLLLQLKNIDTNTDYRDQAFLLLQSHFDLLSERNYPLLLRKSKLSEDALKGALHLIHHLNPRPGNTIENTEADYVIPDVVVSHKKSGWVVELNPETLPKIRINQTYAGIMQQQNKNADQQYLRQQFQEARWLIKSLQSRNETLLKVANCIFEHQRDFLEQGTEHMKPLILNHVAEQIGMHESTVSRITTQKFVETPRGLFELKYFFSSHVGTHDGGECSSTAIRARIKKLISSEPHRKPLSDSKIATLLSREGINIARRTVAKYRENLHIPPSNERKTLV